MKDNKINICPYTIEGWATTYDNQKLDFWIFPLTTKKKWCMPEREDCEIIF